MSGTLTHTERLAEGKKVLVIGGEAEARFAAFLREGLSRCGVEVDCSQELGTSFQNLEEFASPYGLIFTRIYFRPPSSPSKPLIEAFFKRSEWLNLALGLASVLEARRFFNHPLASLVAESKPLQLATARHAGMVVPDTLFSNVRSDIRLFAKGRRCIVKPVDTSLLAHPDRPDDTLLMFTRELSAQEANEENLIEASDSPMIVQTLVEKTHELRVVVYGAHVRTIHIDSQAHPNSSLDFRRRLMDPKMYSVVEEDPVLNGQCLAYCQELGLDGGVFDFAVGVDGCTYFLECNPNGQWGSMNASAGAGVDAAALQYFKERLRVAA